LAQASVPPAIFVDVEVVFRHCFERLAAPIPINCFVPKLNIRLV
jgi:hypothetical protein